MTCIAICNIFNNPPSLKKQTPFRHGVYWRSALIRNQQLLKDVSFVILDLSSERFSTLPDSHPPAAFSASVRNSLNWIKLCNQGTKNNNSIVGYFQNNFKNTALIMQDFCINALNVKGKKPCEVGKVSV